MIYLQKQKEIEAIQINPENYQEIIDKHSGYTVQNGSLYSDDHTKKQDGLWIATFDNNGEKVTKCLTDSLFNILFEKKPVEYLTLGEAISNAGKARKDWFPDGDYVAWNGFTWVMCTSGIMSIYSPTPDEITTKCWLTA